MVNKIVILSKNIDHTNKLFKQLSTNSDNITIDKIHKEGLFFNKMKKIIEEYKNLYKPSDLLTILHERSMTTLTKDQLNDLFNYIQENILQTHDIMYLSNFMDDCSQLKTLKKSNYDSLSGIEFLTAISPKGYYGLVTSFEKWEKLLEKLPKDILISHSLTKQIEERKIKAATTWPRIFIPHLGSQEHISQPCLYKNVYTQKIETTNNLAMYWFIFGSIIVIVCTWLILYFNK